MAHWFEEAGEVRAFLDAIPKAKDSASKRACLRFVFAKAKELATRALKRSVLGLGDEPLDEPFTS